MDPRIRDHASVIVDHSTSVEPGDNVQVRAPARVASENWASG